MCEAVSITADRLFGLLNEACIVDASVHSPTGSLLGKCGAEWFA